MSIFNIIIIGAYSYVSSDLNVSDVSSEVCNWNNPLQASHNDLCKLQNEIINITCYDLLYKHSSLQDNISYVSACFSFDDTSLLCKGKHNIIIEFCNMFDENFINHACKQNKLMKLDDYKITVLACGCAWDKGFPLECVLNIIYSDNIVTPCNPYSVDNYLYVISCIRYIYESNLQDIMQPYLYGLYQNMGTLKWRGSEADFYASENVLRELFELIGVDAYDLSEHHKDDLQNFVEGKKHWNKLSWSLREELCSYIYGCKYT